MNFLKKKDKNILGDAEGNFFFIFERTKLQGIDGMQVKIEV